MSVEITDRDLGWKKIQEIAGKTVQVKVQSVARNTSRKMYAYFVEAGTRFKQGRPFVKQTMEAHGKYRQQMDRIMDRVLAGDGAGRDPERRPGRSRALPGTSPPLPRARGGDTRRRPGCR